jgi:hypothetical protein
MTFWNRLRLAGTVIVLVTAALVLLADLLHVLAIESPEAKPVPGEPQPPTHIRLQRETSGL